MRARLVPGDRVRVTMGRYQGRAGVVVDLSMGMVRVRLDGMQAGDWLAFYPDELGLDLLSEGAQTISGLRSAILAVIR